MLLLRFGVCGTSTVVRGNLSSIYVYAYYRGKEFNRKN
jgi:hypothetical protein